MTVAMKLIKKHLILEKKPMANLDSVYSYVKFKNKIKFKKINK